MRFLAEVGTSSHSYAELAGRTASNINDVVRHLLLAHHAWCRCVMQRAGHFNLGMQQTIPGAREQMQWAGTLIY